ncbi:MAG: T9SS type A sorting domain-containing protein [FCB group bacterium]|nr:T9SS type A sorting domain-containing protein [FCB group bacterium]MBL7029079.1 T9SS type A sorting domain-containing protein [Candidatus Neomarinimicrobiota bacterium]MBL7122559.1 T9SS type A sorting domain-containing protein [Candidatus Neomarinimicrobiota bacterium]
MNTSKTVLLTLALTTLCYSETWINYNLENSNIAGSYAQCMTIDPFNNIYIGCDWAGISKFNGEGWVSWTPDNSGYPANAIEPIDIGTDSEGNLWISSDGSGLVKFDGTDFTEYDAEDNARNLTVDTEDNIWYKNWQDIVTKFDGTTFTDYDTSDFGNHGYLAALSAGPDGSIWMLSDTSLIEFDGDQWLVYSSYHNTLWHQALAFDNSGNVWTGINNAVGRYDGENWISYTFQSDSLNFWFPGALQFDADGILWVGYDFGLARFDGENWTQYTTTNTGQELGWITSLVIDANNNKWLASFGNGVFVFNEDGVVLGINDKNQVPLDFEILNIYPNPMNPAVTISYSLNTGADLSVSIFDITGRPVWTQSITNKSYGEYSFQWKGNDLQNHAVASGVYVIRLSANKSIETRKVLVLR